MKKTIISIIALFIAAIGIYFLSSNNFLNETYRIAYTLKHQTHDSFPMPLYEEYLYLFIPLLIFNISIIVLELVNIFINKKAITITLKVIGILAILIPFIMIFAISPAVMPRDVIVNYPPAPDATTKLSHGIGSFGHIYYLLIFVSGIFVINSASNKNNVTQKSN